MSFRTTLGTRHGSRLARALAVALTGVLLGGCGGGTKPAAEHQHRTLPAGDGTKASYVGYSLDGLELPKAAGTPGHYSFTIGTYRGVPQTKFFTEQTKKLHAYVVRSDYAVFRHLHPTMSADGVWSGNLTLPEPGRYRLVAEFLAVDEGGHADHVILGDEQVVGRPVAEQPLPPATDRVSVDDLAVVVHGTPRSGPDSADNQMRLGVSVGAEPADLGGYLGVAAHVTGFAVDTGAVVHMHPLGSPVRRDGEALLTFHTAFPTPGDYRLFVQVRVSGIVRTVPITVRVS